jgi:hypothetical protein
MAKLGNLEIDTAALAADEECLTKLCRQIRLLSREMRAGDDMELVKDRFRRIKKIASRHAQKPSRPKLGIME